MVATGLSRQGARRPIIQVVRPEHEKATGTYGGGLQVPTLTSLVGTPGAVSAATGGGAVADMDFNTFNRPAVWGNARRTSASAKVDALSSGGMDDIEIPAFLRKQAD